MTESTWTLAAMVGAFCVMATQAWTAPHAWVVLAASDLALSVILGLLGLAVGASLLWFYQRAQGRNAATTIRIEADALLAKARDDADRQVKQAQLTAKDEYLKIQDQFKRESDTTRQEFKELERRLTKKEDGLELKLDTLGTKERAIEKEEKRLAEAYVHLSAKQKEADRVLEEQKAKLIRIAGMSIDDARQQLIQSVERDMEHDCAVLMEKMLNEARETATDKAREITITAIQRYAANHTSESTVSAVDIPSDDMKGRVIGREGRNIRAFEKATGVDVIVDDTPGVVVVSSFDPVRREVARLSLEKLIQDGRIHPTRIEEVVEELQKQVERDIVEAGKQACIETNIGGLNRKVVDLLGRLKYRTSYGQNVLRHSIEVAFLCQNIADELGLDGRLARRCGLLHDIGKAVDHEVEGGHPQIGADICRRFNERPEVLNAIAGHHGDVAPISCYTPIVMAADAISASRPGGRRESLERYIKRLEDLEAIATSHRGVKQAYAIQAGREIRVIVDAEQVDDATAARLAHEIAKEVEAQTTYPGEVKVTVLREVRAVEFAR